MARGRLKDKRTRKKHRKNKDRMRKLDKARRARVKPKKK